MTCRPILCFPARVEPSSLRRRLTVANLRLVVDLARRLHRPALGLSVDDLVRHGRVGVIRAVQRFVPSKGRFSTYAAWWLRRTMLQAGIEAGGLVRLGPATRGLIEEIRLLQFESL